MYPLDAFPIPLLGFAAYSGTGKTTLLTQLIPILSAHGLRIGMVKHSHHDIEMDNPTKDSYKLRKSGAVQMVLASPHRSIIFSEQEEKAEPNLIDQLNWLNTNKLDLVLVEGFRHEQFDKIELHRPSLAKPLLCANDSSIIAIASDMNINENLSVPQLQLNDIKQIADFILAHVAQKTA